jgi:hypothetical protein
MVTEIIFVSLGVKQMGCEADHSPPSTAEVKKEWSYTSIPLTSTWHSTSLITRDNFSFTIPV